MGLRDQAAKEAKAKREQLEASKTKPKAGSTQDLVVGGLASLLPTLLGGLMGGVETAADVQSQNQFDPTPILQEQQQRQQAEQAAIAEAVKREQALQDQGIAQEQAVDLLGQKQRSALEMLGREQQGQVDLLGRKSALDLAREKELFNLQLPLEQQKLEARKAEQAAKQVAAAAKPAPLTEGQKVFERKRGADVAAWQENKDFVLSDIEKLKEVEAKLESGTKNVTGSVIGRLPLQDLVNPSGKDILDTVGSVTQKNLKKILGGQFAQKEGEELLKRAFDPTLDEKVNLKRVRALREAMEKAAMSRDKELNQLFETGSFLPQAGGSQPQSDMDAKLQRLEELRRKKSGQ